MKLMGNACERELGGIKPVNTIKAASKNLEKSMQQYGKTRVASSNPRVMSSNPQVQESLNQ